MKCTSWHVKKQHPPVRAKSKAFNPTETLFNEIKRLMQIWEHPETEMKLGETYDYKLVMLDIGFVICMYHAKTKVCEQ